MRSGKLKFKLVGKRHLVKKEDVEAYFESLPYAPARLQVVKDIKGKAYMGDRELRRHGLRVRLNGSRKTRALIGSEPKRRKARFGGFITKDRAGNMVILIS